MNRHEFLKKSMMYVGGTAAACMLYPHKKTHAEVVPENDPRIQTEFTNYPTKNGTIRAYLATLKTKEKRPAVIVIHENKGLQPHIQDVTRRLALEGFLAIAPDALSMVGGTPDKIDQATKLIRELDQKTTIDNFTAAVQYLKTNPLSTGKVGCIGFSWGGAMANQVAVHSPDLQAAVPYYGSQPDVDDVKKIKASLLLQYAGLDERINKGIPQYEEALKKASINYTTHIYKGAKHAFNNDTNAERYHKDSADLAWKRTVAFLKEKLKA